MAAAIITAARLRELLRYDRATGVFTWRVSRKGTGGIGSIAGGMNRRGYWRIGIDGRRYMANVLAWVYVTGEWPTVDIDHKDNVRHHNWFDNLREVTRSVNNQNQHRAKSDNKSGLLGVSPNRKKWAASIMVDGKKTHLGTYPTPEQAHAVYIAAKRRMHVGNML